MPNELPLDDDLLVEDWVTSLRSDHTREAFRRDWQQWVHWCAGRRLDPWAAERPHVERWRGELAGARYAPDTIARKITAVASCYRYACDVGRLEHSPCDRVSRPPKSRTSSTPSLSAAQLGRLLEAARMAGSLEHAMVMLMALTGIRVTEMCAANVRDLYEDQGVRVLQVTRKGGHRETVTVPAPAATAIDAYVGRRRKGPLLLVSGSTRSNPKALEEARMHRHRALYLLGRLCDAAAIRRITPHGLRHTFAGLGHDAGVDLLDLQTALGHASPATTRRYVADRHLRTHPVGARVLELALSDSGSSAPTQEVS